jgi:hypothetical protein
MQNQIRNHGAPNPIVTRLSLQILEILKQCNASKDIQDAVGNLGAYRASGRSCS